MAQELHRPPPSERAPTKKRASPFAVWIGVGLSVLAAALLVSRVSFRDLGAALAAADATWLLPSVALFLLMCLARVWRWAVLLGRTRLAPTWHANIIGYFFNVTLPLRLGEVARAYVISKNSDVSMARALSAVLVERLFDLASVVLLFTVFAQFVPMSRAFTTAATLGFVAVVVAVVIAILVVVKGEAVERALSPHLARLGDAKAASILVKFRQVREGIASVGSARRMLECLALTALVWGLTIGLAFVCMKAFLPDESDLTRAGLVVVMANLGGALPSAPGGLGIVQGFATSALVVPFGIVESTALAYALVWSLGQQIALILLGFVSIGRVGLSFREIRDGAAPRE